MKAGPFGVRFFFSLGDMAQQIQSRRWLFFLLVATGVLVSTLDSSMINVALPSIMRTFSANLAATELVVLAYLATITIFLVFWGNLADLGKGQVYLKGMLVFAVPLWAVPSRLPWTLIFFVVCKDLGRR